MESTPDTSTGTGTRRQLFSLSLLLHQGKKRTSCIPDPSEPTCQEKSHYPVFNPRDPRHNPEASIFPWRRQESSTSSSESPPRPVTWVHSVSRRSFHRARSGLLALRAGVRRRSTVEDDLEMIAESPAVASPVASRQRRKEHSNSSRAYTTSTQEDLDFGTEMYRMGAPSTSKRPIDPTFSSDTEPLLRKAPNSPQDQTSPLARTASESEAEHWSDFPQVQDSAGLEAETGYAPLGNYMSDANDELTPHSAMEPTPKSLTSTAIDCAESTDSQHIWGKQELEIAPQSRCLEHDADSTCPTCPTCSNLNFNCRTGAGPKQEEITGNSSPSPEATSNSCKSNHSPKIEADAISESSAEVLFAFPGIYQETLDQWTREREAELPLVSQVNEGPTCVVPRDNPSNNPPPYQEYEDYAQGERVIDANRPDLQFPQASRNITLSLRERQPLRSQGLPSTQMHDEHPIESSPCSARSTRYQPISELTHLPEPRLSLLQCIENPQRQNHIRDLTPFPLSPRPPELSDRSPLLSHGRDCLRHPYNECENPLYNTENSTSPEFTSTEITSMTSMSSSLWSPIDSEILFPSPTSNQNEFFMADGKTSSQYPDRGDQPVKSGYHINKDGTMNTRGLNVLRPDLARGIDGAISTGILPRSNSDAVNNGRMDFEDEFTDDEFYPGGYMPSGRFH